MWHAGKSKCKFQDRHANNYRTDDRFDQVDQVRAANIEFYLYC